MWLRLIAVQRHREARLRLSIHRIGAQLGALEKALEMIRAQRAQVIAQWRARSGQRALLNASGLRMLCHQLSDCQGADSRLQQESERLHREIAACQRQLAEQHEKLRQAIAKQEKLRFI